MPDGKRVLLDELLGDGFAFLQLDSFVASEADARGIDALPNVRTIRVIDKANDFLAVDPSSGLVVRDCEGVLANVLNGSNANAVLLRPDRYIHSFY